ncbi:MAG: spore coat protein CotH [Lachnospiraceae bacterium]|nr:spore coat protein CotH [Lachnospiraceae bacterium]
MIKDKWVGRICAIVLALALIFTTILTYFPNVFPLQAAGISFDYETDIFDKSKIVTIDIQMDEDSWQDMLDHASAEEYYACDIVVNGMTYKNVGIRPKGNTSLSQIVSDDTTDRYSFKLEFDHYVDNQTLLGLDKLCLNNIMSDATYMKEFFAYDILTYMGVPSSLYAFASITVNGEPWGLYLALEAVEESYAERNFGGSYGELYKPETMGMGGGGGNAGMDNANMQEFISRFSEEELEQMKQQFENGGGMPQGMPENAAETEDATNGASQNTKDPSQNTSDQSQTDSVSQDENPQQTMPEEMNAGRGNGGMKGGMGQGGMSSGSQGGADLAYTDDEISSYSTVYESAVFDATESDFKRVITALKNISEGNLEGYVDVDEMLRYITANTFLLNDDSYFGTMLHNYYLYEKNGVLSMLPWDYNLAFGGFQGSNATDLINRAIDDVVSSQTSLEARPMIGKILEDEENFAQYYAYLDELISGYFESGLFEQTLDSTYELIASYVKEDATAFYTYDEFETAVDTFREFCNLRAESIRGQLDGTIPSSSKEQAADSGSLIDASGITISDMGSQGGENGGGKGEMNRGQGMGQMTFPGKAGTMTDDSAGDGTAIAGDESTGQMRPPVDGTAIAGDESTGQMRSPVDGTAIAGDESTDQMRPPVDGTAIAGDESTGQMTPPGEGAVPTGDGSTAAQGVDGNKQAEHPNAGFGNGNMPGGMPGVADPAANTQDTIKAYKMIGISVLCLMAGVAFAALTKKRRFHA